LNKTNSEEVASFYYIEI